MNRVQWKRRVEADDFQRWRGVVQGVFLLLNLWIGVGFVLHVRGLEGRWIPWEAARPPGVEGWLPIAGMMNTRYLLEMSRIPAIHPAAMVLFVTFVSLSLILRKSFCGWVCPVGAVSEWFWKTGRDAFGRSFHIPKWLDLVLRSSKYALFSAFFYAVLRMDAESIEGFLTSPYGLIADVKMLNFFRFLSPAAAGFLGFVMIVSLFVPNAWCRYLCPYGALMGLAALVSPLRIQREKGACIDCGKCARACPSRLPVDKLVQIRSAECIGCMECVTACPAEGALYAGFAGKRGWITGQRLAVAIGVVFVVVYMGARLTGHWESAIPLDVYKELVPVARDVDHPR